MLRQTRNGFPRIISPAICGPPEFRHDAIIGVVANIQQPVDFSRRFLIGGVHVWEQGLCEPMRLGIRSRPRARCRCDVNTVDLSFAVALDDGEVSAIRTENLQRIKGLGQQLVPAALGAEVDEVADRQVLVLRPHPAVPVSRLASLVLVEGGAHSRDELLKALIDGSLHHEWGAAEMFSAIPCDSTRWRDVTLQFVLYFDIVF